MAVKLVKKDKTATPSQQGAASAASSEKKKVRLVSTGKPVSALQAPYSTEKTQTSTSTPKYDISGDAWTRATPSQTKVPERNSDGSVNIGSRFNNMLGRYGAGNVDLTNRPRYQNEDGTISTVDGTSFNIDGKEVLLPSVWMKNGTPYHSYNDEEILQHYYDTGEYLGKFDSVQKANEYAQQLHLAQEYLYPNTPQTATSGRTSGGFSGKSSVEDGSPVYNRRTAERMAESFTNAENALTQKRESGIDIVTEVDQRSKDIDNQVSTLKALEEMFNKDRSEANAQKYNAAYEKYAKDVEDYNKLYNEYKTLYDVYNAAYDKYTNYMDAAKSDATWLENAKDAFWTGIAGIDKAFTSTLALPERALQPIIQEVTPGVSTPLSDLADYYSDIYEDVANRRADNLYGKGKIAELASDVGTSTIQALPNAILALMSSGTSIAGQGAAALGTATNTGLASTISNSLQTMAKNPMYWSSFIQTVGTDYEENIENGASNLVAVASALISSALNAGVEIGGGIETLPDAVKNGGSSAVKEWVKSMLDEGKEEVIQDIISGITQKVMYDQDKTWFSTTDENAVVNPGVLAKDFGMGAAVGGILGGMQAGAVSGINAMVDYANKRIADANADYIASQNTPISAQDYAGARQTVYEGNPTSNAQNAAERTTDAFNGQTANAQRTVRNDVDVNVDAVNANQQTVQKQEAPGVQAAYEAGKAELPRERANLETDAQVAAYEQGRRDAILTSQKDVENTAATAYTDVINTKEAVNNGEQGVHLRESSQWADGTNPGGQVRQLEEGTGRDQSWNTQRRPRDGEAAQISYGRKVSTADLGIKGGSKNDGVFLIKSGTTKSMQRAQQIAQQNGKELILFGGHDLHTDKATDGARGYTDGNRIFARVDDPDFTVDQIVRHETGHNLIAEGKVDLDKVRQRVASAVGEDKVDTAASLYAAAYSGTDMTSEDIWEELVCDSLGDMNIFEGIDTVETFMSDFLGVTKQETETSHSTTRGPPITTDKYSSRIGGNENDQRRDGQTRDAIFEGRGTIQWKEDLASHRKGAERNSDFVRRMGQSGASIRRGREYTYGYKAVSIKDATTYAKEVIRELKEFHVKDYFVFDGLIQGNKAGFTEIATPVCCARDDGVIAINNSSKIENRMDAKEAAAHETIHQRVDREDHAAFAFRKAVIANAKISDPMFLQYVGIISHAYSDHIYDMNNVYDRISFFNEFVPYVAGYTYSGTHDVSGVFENFGEVCNALEKALRVKKGSITGKISENRSPINTRSEDFYDSVEKYSARVTDKKTLEFLANQETITTYKTMQLVDGKLYPPMASRIEGKFEDYSVLGEWEQATEHPELIKSGNKFKLDKGKGQGSIEAAYNPYMHSSNLVINDQFSGAYTRDNLVTVECEVPASEMTSGYHAQYAKDAVGWHSWHTGTVAGQIRKAKGVERQVFLSRWIKPVRIVTDAEVASMYKELLSGTDVSVPDNVVTPSLLAELKKAGVNIKESGKVKYSQNLSANIAEMKSHLDEMNREYQQMGWKENEFKASKEYNRFMDDLKRKDVDDAYLDYAIKAYGEWEQKSGYADLSQRMKQMRSEMTTLRGNLERAKEQAAKEARIEYRAKYNDEFAKKYAAKAARKFGTTSRFDLAGYLTVNGTLLDFSERQGYRVQDHREIADVLDFLPEEHGYSDGLVEFMNLGNIRLQSYGIDISKAPNKAQISQLRRFFNSLDGEVTVDFSDENGGSIGSLEYPEGTRADKILSDIDSYFKTGELPEQSETAMFHSWYSRRVKTYEALQQENEMLRERLAELKGIKRQMASKTQQAEYWKGQTKRTNHDTLRQADVDKLTKRIVSEFEGTIDAKEVSGAVKELGEFILRGGNEQDELTWAGVKERAVSIARDIVESAETLVNGDEVSTYKDIKKLLRRKMSISAQDARDIADFYSWKKEHSRKINVGIDNGGLAVDVAYQELSESYPWAFPADVTAPSDQLLQMADVLYSMQPIYENPYSANMMEAVEYCANSIIDGLMDEDVRQTPFTFADKQAAKLADEKSIGRANAADAKAAQKQAVSDATLAGQMAQGRADAKRIRDAETRLEQVKSDARAQAADAKSAQKQAAADAQLAGQMAQGRADAKRLRASEQRYEQRLSAARQAIEDERVKRDERVQRLKNYYEQALANQEARRADSKARTRLLNIAKRLKNKKLPAVNRALLNQYIGELDTVSKSMTGRTLEKLTDLQAWYNDRKANDPDFISDPVIERKLERLAKRQISSMTSEEVADLTDTLLNIEHELQTERKLIDSEDRRDVYHMGEETIENISNSKGSNGNVLDKFIVTETLSPVREMRRMTGYVDSDPLLKATNALADGQRNMLDYQMKAERPFERFANDKVFARMFSGKQADAIQITGETKDGPKTVTITPAMRTALYLHSLNDQNLRHIKEGGITVPDEKLYRAGKLSEAYARGTTIKLTPSQVRSITANMTDKERSFALAAKKYFNDVSKKSINETSEKLKGYSLADVENYFPINTDTSFTRSDFESLKFDGTIEGMGFLKERVNAANPILLRDANAVLEQAIQMHSKYVGLAIPVRNFNKIWSVTTGSFNDDGSRNNFEGSVQSAIKGKWGDAGYSYVEKMMGDLQGGQKQKKVWASAMNKLRSNYAGAVLTLNLSVAIKQAASYPTAAAVLGWTPLVKAMGNVGKVDLALIEKYTPLQWYRSKGFSTKELGDLKSSDKALPAVFNWVQGVDLATTRKLWKASEYYVQMHNKSLERGSDAYYRAVADIYNRVIEETQPNYTTMQRPQLLRSDDTLMQNIAMFKTQPFQNFNILYDAAENLLAKKERAKSGEAQAVTDFNAARTDFGHAVTSQLAQLAVFAGMTAVWAMLRGKTDKYEDDDDDEITMKSFLAAYAKDMAGGAMSSIPFGSDAWEYISSKVFGDKYYGLDVVTVSSLLDTVKSLFSFGEMVWRIGSSSINGDDINWNKERINLDSILDDVSKAAGVPYENVANMVNMAFRNVAIAGVGKYKGEYAYLKLTSDPEKYSGDYYDLLYKSMKKNEADYQAIYNDMLTFGFDEKKIATAIETRMKKEQGVKKVEELEERYLSPERKSEYDSTMSSITGSIVWKKANDTQRDALEERLYGLVMDSGTYKDMQEKIDEGAAYGVTETEYLLFRTALEIVDEPNEDGKMGTYTNEEVQKAIEMLRLSNAESAYLWESQGKSEKSNPWR